MNAGKAPGRLLVVSFLLSACGLRLPEVAPPEVTRLVRSTQLVTVEVTHVVPVTQVVTVEVTRIVRERVVVTPTPPPGSSAAVTPGVYLPLPRGQHTATRLADGRILLTGGSRSPDEFLADVDIFDPATGLFRQAAPLHTPRHGHSATLLPDGRVLVVGGYNRPQQWLTDAEVYDPVADTWSVVPPLFPHGVSHSATLMMDGRVLVVGGCTGSGVCTERVEIFDPQTNAWRRAAVLESNRASQAAQLLADGWVLIAGGATAGGPPLGGDALLYDPRTNAWAATGPMGLPRHLAQAVRLADGRVLIAGGIALGDPTNQAILSSAEIYDPVNNTWTAAADLAQARYAHVLTVLPDGAALAIGGARQWNNVWTEASFVHAIEAYDPATDTWRIVGDLPQPGACAAAAALLDGRVWVTGGIAGRAGATYWQATWLVDPALAAP